jgi:hypothetical protein
MPFLMPVMSVSTWELLAEKEFPLAHVVTLGCDAEQLAKTKAAQNRHNKETKTFLPSPLVKFTTLA